MAKRGNLSKAIKPTPKSGPPRGKSPHSLEIAANGIRTSREFAGFMSALMTDVIQGRVTPGICNAAVNAGGKLLKVVEMSLKYGTQGGANAPNGKVLQLTTDPQG